MGSRRAAQATLGDLTVRETQVLRGLTEGRSNKDIGRLLGLLARAFPEGQLLRHWGLRIGGALFASDLIHHFAVLWPVTGSPGFDLRYPGF